MTALDDLLKSRGFLFEILTKLSFLPSNERGKHKDGRKRRPLGDRAGPGRRVDAGEEDEHHPAGPHARGLRPLQLHRGLRILLRAAPRLGEGGAGGGGGEPRLECNQSHIRKVDLIGDNVRGGMEEFSISTESSLSE